MTDMTIPANERGAVRVFAVDLPPEAAKEFAGGAPGTVAQALGTSELGARHVEVFDVADLKGVGLASYLEQGLGVAPGELDGDRARLDAVTGTVAIVLSGAFDGERRSLAVSSPLRWLGTWHEADAETPEIALSSASAEGAAPIGEAGAPVGASPGSRGLILVVLALVVLAILIWILVA
ncbi:hypothetical protein [Wenxinia marina]|uniref:Aspartate carbamoyltransferase catalytic subunit n=1 Tax=Wenxinia marina DSM 24838 TaxID=1123501 RepID=A0A0D0PG76_9RHOB|nr:hypothetical protein [Wenxinia marina]KIQ70351.1 hypothetical protein Wenmar_00727 [Wenxinia marina DSM 24838]GGL53820.1 hypothetical protein GCM10011392_05250 [Wenxinia marina]